MQKESANPASSLGALSAFARRDQLETPETYLSALKDAIEVLPLQGVLLHLQDIPIIIVPDIHARREMLITLLRAQFIEGSFAGQRVFDLLEQGCMNVVCVGGIVHSEERSH
jgi:hypothetical protein